MQEIDEYKNEVTQLARPLPVEYLLLDMPAAFPVEPRFSLPALPSDKQPFTVENRANIGETQDFNAFCTYMAQFSGAVGELGAALGDFHVLLYMAHCDVLPLREHMAPLLHAVRDKDDDVLHRWRKEEHWATVEQLMQAHGEWGMASQGMLLCTGEVATPWRYVDGAYGQLAVTHLRTVLLS